jgi:hypothetical protein
VAVVDLNLYLLCEALGHALPVRLSGRRHNRRKHLAMLTHARQVETLEENGLKMSVHVSICTFVPVTQVN